MRIDDENKVVVPDFVAEWYEKTNRCYILGVMLDELGKSTDEKIKSWRWSCKGRMANGFGNSQEVVARMMMFGYTIEQPQKYYWRKKKEHLAWFEKIENSYLVRFKFSGEVDYSYTLGEVGSAPIEMTEPEAKELLKDDFDMFEKVEVE